MRGLEHRHTQACAAAIEKLAAAIAGTISDRKIEEIEANENDDTRTKKRKVSRL